MAGGILKKHRATYAIEGARLWGDNYNAVASRNATGAYRQGLACPMIKALDGTEWNYIFGSRGYANNYDTFGAMVSYNTSSFNSLTAYATGDLLENWGIDDWEINALGSTTQGKATLFSDQIMQQTYTITIENTSNEDIEISCIRFSKSVALCTSQQYNASNSSPQYTLKSCLAYSYYLDEPITISPGNTHTLTIKFSPTED